MYDGGMKELHDLICLRLGSASARAEAIIYLILKTTTGCTRAHPEVLS